MILFKKCPCCKNRIFVGVDLVCKYIQNSRCYYCPECNNQITKPREIKKENQFFGIAIGLLGIFIIRLISNEETIFVNLLWVLLIIFLGILIWGILYGAFRKLTCIKESVTKINVKRDKDISWTSMDDIESENWKGFSNLSRIIVIYGLILIIILSIFISLFKYIV